MQHQQNSKLQSSAAATTYDYAYQQQYQQQQPRHLISEATGTLSEEDPLPAFEEFQGTINEYLGNLSPKKRDKALVDHARYCLIQEVLKNPRDTSISTAQFRFWVKKMFQLQPGSYDLVCHDNKPVAMKEQIYDILVNAHTEAHHGGRDKTSAIVRNQFSWIPKELVARFVRQCPTCISRRNGSQSLSAYTSKTSSPTVDHAPSTSTGGYCYDAVTMAAAAAAATTINTSTPVLLYTPSSKTESDILTSLPMDNAYKKSPNSCIAASPSIPKRPLFGHDGLFESGDPYIGSRKRQNLELDLPTSYQMHSATGESTSNNVPFTYRRQQQECMNYSTCTEHPPSYYNALMNSYHHNNTNAALIEQHNNNNSGSFLPAKMNQESTPSRHQQVETPNTSNRSSILSHINSDPLM